MTGKENLRPYYKFDVFAFFNGFGGSVWGGFTYYFAIPVAYLTFLNASNMQIGLITAIFWAGFSLPQIWAAYVSETKTIKKGFMARVLILSSISWLILGIYIFITSAANASFSIWMFLILFTWACALTGMFFPGQFSLLFKIIPMKKLGMLLGIMFSIQFAGQVLTGPIATKISSTFSQPFNYAVLFLSTFVISLLIAILLLSIKEPEGETIEGSLSFGAYLGKCVTIIKSDKILTKFIIGKWLMSGHYIMLAFLLVYLINERGFDPLKAGMFPALQALGLFIGGFTITKIADIYGPKYMLITSHVIAVLYTVIVWLIPSAGVGVIFGAFIITGLAQISDNVGYTNMCVLCCPILDKSTYVAVTNIGVNLLTVPLPIIIGKLLDMGVLNYNKTFTIVLCMMVAAIVYLFVVVENPKAFVEMKAGSNR